MRTRLIPSLTRRDVLSASAASVVALVPAPLPAANPASARPSPALPGRVHLDQIGFPATGAIWALHVSPVRQLLDPQRVFVEHVEGMTAPRPLRATTDPVYDFQADQFSSRLLMPEFEVPGVYRLRMGTWTSEPFLVSDGLWQGILQDALRSFYLQRCGVALNDPRSGLRHRPCHVDDNILADGSVRAGGGWHEGPSYDKTVRTAAYVLGHVLGAFLAQPSPFGDRQTRIPESGNGQPDALDEMQVSLTWLMGLQREDGGVHGGVRATTATGPVMPHDDIAPRVLLPVTLADTSLASAAMALGARTFRTRNADLSRELEACCARGLAFIEAHQMQAPVPAAAWSARLWALSEWALLTDDPKVHARLAAAWGGRPFNPPAPEDTAGFAMLHRLSAMDSDPQGLHGLFTDSLVAWSEAMCSLVALSPYGVAEHRFTTGSNRRVAATGASLAAAYSIRPSPDLRAVAHDHLHYLLGRNAVGQSFISGPGPHAAADMRHPMAQASNKILPGFLVTGPDRAATDPRTPKARGAASYADHHGAADSNSASLSATAALIALIAGLMGT